MGFLLKVLQIVKSSPLWFAVPALAVVGVAGMSAAGYSPLEFDPSLYQTQALATELSTVDAEALEKGRGSSVEGESVEGQLEDGQWTGYAPCGMGNPDNWKPYYVGVTIEVADGAVTGIVSIFGSSNGDEGQSPLNWDAGENQEYLSRAINGRGGAGVQSQIQTQLQTQGEVTGIDTVSGATYSSASIYNAYIAALRKAGGEGVPEDLQVSGKSSTAGPVKHVKADEGALGAKLADGTWIGYSACGRGNSNGWKPYYVAVTISVKDGKVAAITDVSGSSYGGPGNEKLRWDSGENQRYLSWASGGRNGKSGVKTQINNQLKKSGKVSSVDTISGATYSSEAIYRAFVDALKKSAAAAGSKLADDEQPADALADAKKDDDKPKTPAKVALGPDVQDDTTQLADGLWVGYAPCGEGNEDDWAPYYVAVTVEVKGGKVVRIVKVEGASKGEQGDPALKWNADENQVYLDWAISGRTRGSKAYAGVSDQISAALAAGNAPKGIDAVSGATYSSQAIAKAYYAAVRKAAVAGGAKAGEAEDGVQVVEPTAPVSQEQDAQNASDPRDSGQDSGAGDSKSGSGNSGGSAANLNTGMYSGIEDGTYSGYAFCDNGGDGWSEYYVFVDIQVKDGAVSKVSNVYGDAQGKVNSAYVYDTKENASYLNKAISGTPRTKGMKAKIQAKLDAQEKVAGIDTVSGATYSSKAILAAFSKAVEEALKHPAKTDETLDDNQSAGDDPGKGDAPAGDDPGTGESGAGDGSGKADASEDGQSGKGDEGQTGEGGSGEGGSGQGGPGQVDSGQGSGSPDAGGDGGSGASAGLPEAAGSEATGAGDDKDDADDAKGETKDAEDDAADAKDAKDAEDVKDSVEATKDDAVKESSAATARKSSKGNVASLASKEAEGPAGNGGWEKSAPSAAKSPKAAEPAHDAQAGGGSAASAFASV